MAFWNKDDKNSALSEDKVLGVLKQVQDPDLRKDIVSLGFIRNLKIESGKVSFDLNLTTPACPVKDQMRDQALARERRSHSSRPMRPRRASPSGTSERSSTRPPQYRASGSRTTSRGSPTALR